MLPPGDKIYPYFLRIVIADHPNLIWAIDIPMSLSENQGRTLAKRKVMPTSDPKRIQLAATAMPDQTNILSFFVPPFFLMSLSARIPVNKVTATLRFLIGIMIPSEIFLTEFEVSIELYNTKIRTIHKRAIIPLTKQAIAKRFVSLERSNFSPVLRAFFIPEGNISFGAYQRDVSSIFLFLRANFHHANSAQLTN
jgi:hypothetical protein